MSIEMQAYTPRASDYFSIEYSIPKKCPHCNVVMYPQTTECQQINYDDSFEMNFILLKCTSCLKRFLVTFLRQKGTETVNFLSVYPSIGGEEISKTIEDFSPKFVKIYKQAVAAEQLNHIELAATGYRMALEVLSKEFAILENPDKEDKIKNATLNNCLKEYFGDVSLSVAGHVVRILGNDYVHYIQKHPNVGFDEIKYFMNIFLLNIEMRLKIKNPPVPVPQG